MIIIKSNAMKIIILIAACVISMQLHSQNIAINNDGSLPHASAMLDIKSSNKGLLLPRVNLISDSDIVTIVNPRISLLVYNNNNAMPDGEGFYLWNGIKWSKLSTKTNIAKLAWNVAGNSGTSATTDFIGTTDNTPLVFKTNNILSGKIDPGPNNVFFGQSAGLNITTGNNNSFFGHLAGNNNTTGVSNLFAGALSGESNTIGIANVFVGQEAGKNNTIGELNTFLGEDAGIENTVGSYNTFVGNGAGRDITSANNCIAIGTDALVNGGATDWAIAIGNKAGYNDNALTFQAPDYAGIYIGQAAGFNGGGGIAIGDSASYNSGHFASVAIGKRALKNNTTGFHDVGIGFYVLENNTNGEYNTAMGSFALNENTTGDYNVAIGSNALDFNITGDFNTALGHAAGPQNSFVSNLFNTTAIGYHAAVTTSNTMVFGDAAVDRWAFGITTTGAQHAVEVGSNNTDGNGAYLTQGGSWTNTSDVNKKEDFTEINTTDLFKKISQLNIQRWKYKGTNEYHIGPTAQDFYKLFNVGIDDKGISTVDPAGITLAAIQELIKQNEDLKKRITTLEKSVQSH